MDNYNLMPNIWSLHSCVGGFISICLVIQSNRIRLPSWLEGWNQSFQKLDEKKQLIIQRSLWTTLIVTLLVASAFLTERLIRYVYFDSLWDLLHARSLKFFKLPV